MSETSEEGRGAVAGQVQRPVRPSLLTEKELLEIVDALIRDRAFNRPAAVAIAMAVGAAVEAEARERCARLCESETLIQHGEFGAGWVEGARACAALIRGA